MTCISDVSYGLILAFFDEQNQLIYRTALDQHTLRRFCRSAQFAGYHTTGWDGSDCSVTVCPAAFWRGKLPSVCLGLDVVVRQNGHCYSRELPIERLTTWAEEIRSLLISGGALAANQRCTWYLFAVKADQVAQDCILQPPIQLPGLKVVHAEHRPEGQPLHPELEGFTTTPCYIASTAMNEALEYCRADPTVERGGVFYGDLCADEQGLFVRAEAFIAAQGAPAHVSQMQFDRAAWGHILEQRAQRGLSHLDTVAWLHSHPRGTAGSEDKPESLKTVSGQDAMIHSDHFPDPHLTALIVDPEEEDQAQAVTIWGWDRYGITLQQQTIYVTGEQV